VTLFSAIAFYLAKLLDEGSILRLARSPDLQKAQYRYTPTFDAVPPPQELIVCFNWRTRFVVSLNIRQRKLREH
jgi:hypothetical protein